MDDYIKREDALNAICKACYLADDEDYTSCESYQNEKDTFCEYKQFLLQVPSAQLEPCENAVSREAVSEWLKQYGQDVLHGKYKFSLMYIWKNLMDLPTVQPKSHRIPCKDEYEYQGKLEKAYDDGYDTGYAQAKFDYEPRWIPVDERLPEEEKKEYWICTDTGYQCECRWTDVNHFWTDLTTSWHWHIMDVPQYAKVVAWMPLPEPYKEGE